MTSFAGSERPASAECLKCGTTFEPSQFSADLCPTHKDNLITREHVIHRNLRDLAERHIGTPFVVAIRRSGANGSQGMFWVFEPVRDDPAVFGIYVEKDCRPDVDTLSTDNPYYRSRTEFLLERDGDPEFSSVDPKRRSFAEQTHPLRREMHAVLDKIGPTGTNSKNWRPQSQNVSLETELLHRTHD